MSLVLGTNYNALVAQNSLASSGSALATSLQQLSSGLRINTAADDAAGYAIVQGMTSQIGGLNQASRNASDGVSLTQTASGALQEITNDLQTMRDLAVQSLNATNSAQDRVDLNQQFQQLSQDVDTVAKTAAFNGVNLLDGTFQGATFQIGANAGQTITVATVASARTSQLGASYSASVTSGATTAALLTGDMTINGNAIVASVAGASAGQSAASAYSIAQAINNSQSVVTASANPTAQIAAGAAQVGALANNDLIINGVNVGVVAAAGSAGAQATADTLAINAVSGATGVTATNNAGTLTLSAADGRDIIITGTGAGTTSSGFALATTHGTVTLSSTAPTGIVVAGAGVAKAGLAAATTAATLTGTAISNTDVLSVGTANASLASIDSALQQVAASGAQLGAYQNRFQSIITGINTTSSNLQAARSSIQDTDYAAATGAMSKAQILQQAGTAMVAQANMIPQNILTLLQKLP